MIVADNSVVTEILIGSDRALVTAIADSLEDRDVVVPELLDVEAMSAIRCQVLSGRLDVVAADRAIRALEDLPFERAPHGPLVPRAWELRDDVSPYDAVYVALAEALRAPASAAQGALA